MTPQSSFMVLAAIRPEREAELRELLDSMNDAPGRVNANNALIPFAEFSMIHVARLIVLKDNSLDDIKVYGLPPRDFPLYLAFLGNIDGEQDAFYEELARRASNGLRALFSCCEGFTAETQLVEWMKSHSRSSVAGYTNWLGRTVARVREEANLHDTIDRFLQSNARAFASLQAQEVHAAVRAFISDEISAGRLKLSAEAPTPMGWQLRNLLHKFGLPLLALLFLPILIPVGLILAVRLRRLEKTDPELCFRVDQEYSDALARLEDHDVTNQFTAMGSLKPGTVRLWTATTILRTIDYAARHIFNRGRLARIRTIHFARWVFLDDKKRMVFFSDYDGSFESYMDDFINKSGFGLNVVFSNGIGYPRTNWLIFDGCADELKYKEFLRRHTLPTQVWYKAYPGLTAVDLERNTRIRRGVESSNLNNAEARIWVGLL
jgi:hypothetical protein